jgi:hypothetical protein
LYKLVIDIDENIRGLFNNLNVGTLRSRNLLAIVFHIAIANFEVMTIDYMFECHIAIKRFIVLKALTIDPMIP